MTVTTESVDIKVKEVKYSISRMHDNDNKFIVSVNSLSSGSNFSPYPSGVPRTSVVTIINDKIVDGLPIGNAELESAIKIAIATLREK